jgi:PKD repeat protein
MKKILYNLLWVLTILVLVLGCKEDDPELGPPPSATDAEFTFAPTAESDNDIVFTSATDSGIKKWDFGNGETAEGNSVSTSYIFEGSYNVTLTVYTKGGSVSTTKTVEIEQTDLSKLPEEYTLLTGGVDYPDGKTWVVDATSNGHMGIGPASADAPIWWAAKSNEKDGSGLYDDKHTFKLDGLEFIQETQGDVFINTQQASNFPGSYANVGDYTAPYEAPSGLKWSYSSTANGKFITITSPGFIGYYTGVSTYQILSISETELYLKYTDAANAEFGWFLRLIPEGFEPPPPPPPAKSTLPIDFEGSVPPFAGFGGSTYEVVANPAAGGINTSGKVGKYVKGFDGNWAGLSTDLTAKIDFSTNPVFKYKVYSPVAGKALFKIETTDNSASPIEVFATVTKINEWEELTFDFSSAASNTFDRIALFLDFDNNAGGTFYMDDIRQTSTPAALTLADLTGASAKVWKLKPAAGSFGVAPDKGSDAWWPNGADISGARPCLFNDEFIFKTGNVYEYDSKGDIWGEGYMGLADGCTAETNLPANAAAWGSGTHSFSFTPANGSTPATITVTGTGAFIALPKAKNGAEYSAAPPDTDGSVTYEVLSYSKTATAETLTITVNIPGGYWTFVLVAQ